MDGDRRNDTRRRRRLAAAGAVSLVGLATAMVGGSGAFGADGSPEVTLGRADGAEGTWSVSRASSDGPAGHTVIRLIQTPPTSALAGANAFDCPDVGEFVICGSTGSNRSGTVFVALAAPDVATVSRRGGVPIEVSRSGGYIVGTLPAALVRSMERPNRAVTVTLTAVDRGGATVGSDDLFIAPAATPPS